MKCTVYDLEVMGSNPGQVELWVRSTSVRLEPKTLSMLRYNSCWKTQIYKVSLKRTISQLMILKLNTSTKLAEKEIYQLIYTLTEMLRMIPIWWIRLESSWLSFTFTSISCATQSCDHPWSKPPPPLPPPPPPGVWGVYGAPGVMGLYWMGLGVYPPGLGVLL